MLLMNLFARSPFHFLLSTEHTGPRGQLEHGPAHTSPVYQRETQWPSTDEQYPQTLEEELMQKNVQ